MRFAHLTVGSFKAIRSADIEFGPGLNTLAEEPIEHRGRCRTVETSVVKTQTNIDRICHHITRFPIT